MTSDSEFIAELAEAVKDLPFEPFSELAISMRQKMPNMLMAMAALGFGGGTIDEADRTLAREQLHISLMHMAYLAENGMAVAVHDYEFEPHGATVRYLLTRMKRAFGGDGSQEDLDRIRYDLNCLLPWVEIGLAIPTSGAAQ